MICDECKFEGKLSKIYLTRHDMPKEQPKEFYDEAGKFHSHDPTINRFNLNCTNGHTWVIDKVTGCKSCDYGSKKRV